MKPIPDIIAYSYSQDVSINASITLLKVYKRLRRISATYTPDSHYKKRLKHKRAVRRATQHIVR